MTRSFLFLVALLVAANAVAAEGDELKNLKPGTLLILDFGGRSVCEFRGYSSSGWIRVRKKTATGERETTHSPGKYSLAPAGAVFGQTLADEDAPKELQNLKPGTKLLVDWGGETVGEFIEYSSFGKLKVRMLSNSGTEVTVPLSAKYVVRLAKPDEPFGWRAPEKPATPRPPSETPRPPNVAGPAPRPGGPLPSPIPGAPRGLPGTPPGGRPMQPGFINPNSQTLKGSWKVVAVVEEGKSRAEGLPIKIVIGENEIQIDRSPPLRLKLDSLAKPATMDIGENPLSPAIYRFTGDVLMICKSNGSRRPTTFEPQPGDSAELYVCQRCVSLAFAPTVPGGNPPPETLSALLRLVEMLKAGQYREFIVDSLPPEQWANPPNDLVQKGVAELQNKGPRLLALLQAVVPMEPLYNTPRSEAVYDVSHYHIDGAPADSSVVFRKRAGRWYLADPRDPLPEKNVVAGAPTPPPNVPASAAPAPVSAPPPTVATVAPATPPAAAAADPDLARLLGSWQVVRFEEGGKEQGPDRVPFKIRFSETVFMLGTLPMEPYRLNSAATPKQLDYGTFRADTTAIFELDGDSLKICTNTGPGKPRPTDFTTAPGDGRRNLLICKRIKPVAAGELGPFSQVEPMLTVRLGEMARIVETEGFAGFMEKCVPPQDQRRLTAAEREEAKKVPQQRITSMIDTLRAMQRMDPQLNADKTVAVYDLTGVHVESDPTTNFQELKLTKVNGQWYLLEK